MSANYREPQFLLPNCKNLKLPGTGTSVGSGLTEDRHSLYSMDFNSTTEKISFTSSIDLGINSTISFWAKFDSFGGVLIGEFSYGAGYLFYIDGSNIYIRIAGTAKTFAHSLSTNQWCNITIVRNGDSIEVFVNNTSLGTQTGYGTSVNTKFDTLGHKPAGAGGGSYPFKGDLDEVAGWSRALSNNEINDLWNGGSPSNPMLLSGKPDVYYPLGEQARNPNGSSDWRFPNEVLQGQAINFDGTDYIDAGSSLGLIGTGVRTFSVWLKTSSNAIQTILGTRNVNSDGWVIQWNQPGILFFNVLGGTNKGIYSTTGNAANLTDGNWHHLVIVRAGTGNNKIYVDGVSQTLNTAFGDENLTDPQSSKDLLIGAGYNTGGTLYRFFNGQMSNLAIWNSDQSANIENIYNYGAPQTSYTVTPTVWYKLDKTSKFTGLNPNWHSALSFNSTSSNYITVDNSSGDFNFGTSPFSISLWFNGTTFPGTYTAVLGSHGSGSNSSFWAVYVHDSDGVFIFHDGQLIGGGGSISTNEWHHYAVTRDTSGNLITYLNGVPVNTATGKTGTFNSASTIRIADDLHNSNPCFNGKLSNVAVYKQAISAEDIKYLYNGGTPQTNISFEPTSWYKLDNTGTGIQDSGSASNDGTNNGASPVTDSVAVDEWVFENTVQSQTPNWSSALDFDGSSSQITLDSDFIAANEFSISIWLKPDDVSNNNFLGDSSSSSNFFRLSSTTQMKLKIGGNPALDFTESGGNNLTVSAWNHIFIYRDSSNNVGIFVNGQTFSSTQSHSLTLTLSTIGRATNIFYEGEISNVAFWDSDQSSEISNMYNNGSPVTSYTNIPTSWYKLNNTTTGIQDSGSSGNDGTNNGAAEIQTNVWTPRLNGESDTLPSTALVSSDLQFNSAYSSFSLNFDSASGDYINCGGQSIFNGLTAFSISFWIKTNGTQQDYATVIGYQSATTQYVKFAFYPSEKDRIRFTLRPGTTNPIYVKSSAGSIVDGKWVHVVGVGDSNNLSNLNLYINGVLDNDATLGNMTTLAQSTDIYIGTDAGAITTREFNGKIDETAIWNRALNQAEITSIYNNGYPKDLTSLSPVSWWRLGEDAYFNGNDFIIPNQITGASNGTSNGMPATALVADAPGSYAAGLGSSLALDDRVGDAPLSTANSLSFNMTPENRISYAAGYTPAQVDNIYSMAFDGQSYVDTSLSLNNTYTGLTLSAWVNYTSISNYTGIIFGQNVHNSTPNSTVIAYTVSNKIQVYYNDGGTIRGLTSTTTLSTGTWYNVILRFDGSTMKLYINGSEEASDSLSSINNSASNLILGAYSNSTQTGYQSFLNGKLDEVAIFDYALSERQIKQDIYNATTTGKTADLNNNSNLTAPVAWYRMGD